MGCRHTVLSCCLILLSVTLGACASKDPTEDLAQFVKDTEENQQPHIEPLPEIKPYKTFLYAARLDEFRNPFAPASGSDVAVQIQRQMGHGDGPKPDLNRRKEALEQYPLDALRMQGTLSQNGVNWGIVIAPDGAVHRVKVDNYLGQNYGRIIDITEDGIEVVELVPDGVNGWQQRQAELALNQ